MSETATIDSASEILTDAIRYALLAPSVQDSQPWRFHVEGQTAELFLNTARAVAVIDPVHRELMISCGAALFNFQVALAHLGYDPHTTLLPDPSDRSLLAKVVLGPRGVASSGADVLFDSITRRHTNRDAFSAERVPITLQDELQNDVTKEGAWVDFVEDVYTKSKIKDLVLKADEHQLTQAGFRRQFGASAQANTHSQLPQSVEDRPARDAELATATAILAVIGTRQDDASSWLRAGQALERVLLRCRAHEVWASFLNQPVEVEALRHGVAKLVEREGYPQVLVRLGYATSP